MDVKQFYTTFGILGIYCNITLIGVGNLEKYSKTIFFYFKL